MAPVAVCCSVLQCVAVCCSQCVGVGALQWVRCSECVAVSVLQCVAMCCSECGAFHMQGAYIFAVEYLLHGPS